MERDAIVQSLLDSGGNKVKAAVSLGMSRATIYRKIHEYGIVTPTGLFVREGGVQSPCLPGRECPSSLRRRVQPLGRT